jgi:hypothetical protein
VAAMRVPALLEQAALGALAGVVAVDLAFDWPVVSSGASPDSVARATAYYQVPCPVCACLSPSLTCVRACVCWQVTLQTPVLTVLVVAALAALSVVRVVSLRHSQAVGQLVATATLLPVAAMFVGVVLPAEQAVLAAGRPVTDGGIEAALAGAAASAVLVPSLLLIAWGHVALAGALAISAVLTVAYPARRRLSPLPAARPKQA